MKELLTYWPSLSLLVISVIAYGIHELHAHKKLPWMKEKGTGFWDGDCDKRKYKDFDSDKGPRFFLSTSLFVAVTDAPHALQFIYVNGICLAVALLFPNTLLTFVIVRGTWGIIFTATYKLLSR